MDYIFYVWKKGGDKYTTTVRKEDFDALYESLVFDCDVERFEEYGPFNLDSNGTIHDWIVESELENLEEELEKLTTLGAPGTIIKNVERKIRSLKKGVFKIEGNRDLLFEEVRKVEIVRRSDGNVYVEFNGSIRYFSGSNGNRRICV